MATEYYLGLLIICAIFLEGIMASDEKIDESAVLHTRQKRIATPHLDNPHEMNLNNPTRVLITCDGTTVQVGYAIHPYIVVTWAQAFYDFHHPALEVAEPVPHDWHFQYHTIRHNRPHPDFIPYHGHNDNDVTVLEVNDEIIMRPNSADMVNWGNYGSGRTFTQRKVLLCQEDAF